MNRQQFLLVPWYRCKAVLLYRYGGEYSGVDWLTTSRQEQRLAEEYRQEYRS